MDSSVTPNALPFWAAFFTQKEYARFLAVITQYFSSRQILYTLNQREFKVQGAPTRFSMLALEELALRCKRSLKKDWPALIHEKLDQLQQTAAFEEQFIIQSDSYSYIRGFLGVRLYPASYIAHFDKDQLLGKSLTEEIYAMLVFDLGGSIKNVDPSKLAKWKTNLNVVFKAAVENDLLRYPLDARTTVLNHMGAREITGDHFSLPNLALRLKQFPSLAGSFGSLVLFPDRYTLVIYPLADKSVPEMAEKLLQHFRRQLAAPLSTEVYWYLNGHMIKIPHKVKTDGRVRVQLPPLLQQLLDESVPE